MNEVWHFADYGVLDGSGLTYSIETAFVIKRSLDSFEMFLKFYPRERGD